MFKLIRNIFLLVIIAVVGIGGYYLFNHNKSVKGSEKVSDTVVLDASETYTIDLYKLSVKTKGAKVNIHPVTSDGAKVDYTVNQGLIDEFDFEVKVDDDKIDVFTGHNYAYDVDKFVVDIYCNFDKLILSSSLDINVDATACTALEVTYNGTNSLDIDNINLNSFKMKTNSSGEVELKGSVNTLEFTSKGSGKIKASELQVTEATVTLDGTGDMSVSVSNTLNVTINDKGSLTYKGQPTLTKHGDGEGQVLQVQE